MNQRGMTLIELLVGAFIASIVGYIAFDLIRDEQGNYTRTRTKVRLQSDAREAIRVIEEDLANIGFRTGLATLTKPGTIDSTTGMNHARDTSCEALSLESRLLVLDDGGTGSDTLEARFFQPDKNLGVACASTPVRIRYFVAADSTLWRVIHNAGTPLTAAANDSSSVLRNVATLQLQVALDTLRQPANTPLPAQSFKYPAYRAEQAPTQASETPGAWTFNGGLVRGKFLKLSWKSDSLFEVKNWSSASERSFFYKTAHALHPRSTYQIECMVQVSPDFKSGMTAVSTPSSHLTLVAVLGGTILDQTEIRRPTLSTGCTWISWRVQTAETSGPLKLEFRGQLSPLPSGAAPVLSVGSMYIRRLDGFPDLSLNRRMAWTNAANTDAARRQIEGLRLWLVSRSAKSNNEGAQTNFSGIGNWNSNETSPSDRNSYAVFERIIPVVHHGY